LRFPGQYYDAETGNFYNYFRDYSPVLGRYLESDPLGVRAGLNTYAYVGGNPLSFIDRLGLDQTSYGKYTNFSIDVNGNTKIVTATIDSLGNVISTADVDPGTGQCGKEEKASSPMPLYDWLNMMGWNETASKADRDDGLGFPTEP